jgi:hypothetical protein
MPALLGGLFIGVLSSLPIVSMGNACCCLWVVSGGVLAAWMMQQNTPRPVTAGEGAIVGLMAGCLGAVLMLAGLAAMLALSRAPIDFSEVLREAAQSPEMTPEGRQALENLNPAVLIAFIGVGLFVIYAAMATLGGLLGAAIFKKKQPPAPPMPPPPTSFTPPVFSPPSPVAPPPPMGPPPSVPPGSAPPMSGSALSGGTIGGPGAYTPAPPAPPDEPYAGDAPTMLIPSRGPTLPPPPVPPPPVSPPSGATPPPPPDREPDSH